MRTIHPLGFLRRLFQTRRPQLGSPVPSSDSEGRVFEKRSGSQDGIQAAENGSASPSLSFSAAEAGLPAIDNLDEAAHHGNAEAQFHLGNRFHTASLSRGSPESDDDRIRAYVWFHLAAAQGHRKAQASCDMLNLRMSDAELQEGNRRIREMHIKRQVNHPSPSEVSPG